MQIIFIHIAPVNNCVDNTQNVRCSKCQTVAISVNVMWRYTLKRFATYSFDITYNHTNTKANAIHRSNKHCALRHYTVHSDQETNGAL